MNEWIWLASIEGLGPIKKKKLLEKFEAPENIYKARKADLLAVEGITEELATSIKRPKDNVLLKKYEAYLQKNHIQLVNIEDEAYPEKLRQIYAPPITLFCIGDISLLQRISIGIVGTRKPSSYGVEVAKKFAKGLSAKGIVVVSGMAKGIDTASHVGTFEASSETIAVLGCGVDIVYPSENVRVYNEIAKRGLIVSEYIVGTKPDASHFPQRNRIISGLSSGVLVVEAKRQSGTMITTDFALDQGRDLFVIPGNITSPNSEGTNHLIQEGAKLVTSVEDIWEDLQYH